jgi:type IV pilus assembly protein PilO
MQERDGLHQRNEALRAEVLKARTDEANLRAFRVQAAALRQRLEVAKERLPSEKEMPRLYRQITDMAAASGLGVALFAPKPPEDKDVLAEVPIAMTAEAGYHQFGAFLDRLGRLPRIVTLGDFKWSGIERPAATVRAEMTLATYIFRGETAAPAPAKPGAPGAAPAAPGAAPLPKPLPVPAAPGPTGAGR